MDSDCAVDMNRSKHVQWPRVPWCQCCSCCLCLACSHVCYLAIQHRPASIGRLQDPLNLSGRTIDNFDHGEDAGSGLRSNRCCAASKGCDTFLGSDTLLPKALGLARHSKPSLMAPVVGMPLVALT